MASTTQPTVEDLEDLFVIEQDIPIPDANERPLRNHYPFRKMQIGDSFLVTNTRANALQMAALGWANYNFPDRKFTTRTLKEGVRIWRTS